MKQQRWILISGLIWGCIGVFLLFKGLQILTVLKNQNLATLWISIGLLIGFIKGRFVLSKTVNRITKHIYSLSEPIALKDVYPLSYWILVSSMFAIGFFLRLVPLEIRGFVDVTIGSALINGAMLYFKKNRQNFRI